MMQASPVLPGTHFHFQIFLLTSSNQWVIFSSYQTTKGIKKMTMKTYEQAVEKMAAEHLHRQERIEQYPSSATAHNEVMASDVRMIAFIYNKAIMEVNRDIKDAQEIIGGNK